ncbi:MAG: hypothetical protein WAL01_06295, partial [Pseudolabrys sp.]
SVIGRGLEPRGAMYADHVGLCFALRSTSSKNRVIPTVECASFERSTHPVSARDCAESKRRNISTEQMRPRISFQAARKAESITRQELLDVYPVLPSFGITADKSPRLV